MLYQLGKDFRHHLLGLRPQEKIEYLPCFIGDLALLRSGERPERDPSQIPSLRDRHKDRKIHKRSAE